MAIVFFVWALLLGIGFWKLLTYSNTPGESAHALSHWPGGTALEKSSHLPTLIVFAHPHCPCSEASIGELARLMPHIQSKVKIFVVFFKPSHQSENWAKASLWNKAQEIPNVSLVLDDGGVEANRFDANTSGQTFLYDISGNLVFSGGITSARGHMGDNLGRDSILEFIETGKTSIPRTPVFGCSLKNPAKEVAKEVKRAPAGGK